MASRVRIGITGHQGLTESTVLLVRRALDTYFKSFGAISGISSLAEGADQIFAQSVLRIGGQLVVIVPSSGYASTFDAPEDLRRYQKLLQRAATVIELDYPSPSEEAFWAAGRSVVDHSDVLVAVWDGEHSKGLGGTGDVVGYARESGTAVEVIWPDGASRR